MDSFKGVTALRKIIAFVSAISLITLTSCGMEKPLVVVNNSEDVVVASENATEFRTDVSVGNICVSYGDTSDAEVHAEYKIQGITQNKVSTVSEHLSCIAEIEDDVLVVSIIDPETGKSFWEWKNSNAKAVEVEADVNIVLPKDFNRFFINADVGNVEIENLCGEFEVNSDVGNLEMNNISILNDSVFSVDVGNCSISLGDVEECDVKVSVDVGDINLDIGEHKYSTASGGDDKPVGGKEEIVVDGKCNIKLGCDVGNIDINQEG